MKPVPSIDSLKMFDNFVFIVFQDINLCFHLTGYALKYLKHKVCFK